MIRLRGIVVLWLGAVLLAGATGCASTTTTPGGSTSAGPTSAGSASGCKAEVVLTEASTGTVCVAKGGAVLVLLHGSADQPWSPVQATGEALSVVANPSAASASELPAGAGYTAAAFSAVQAGTATVTSSRGSQTFLVTVTVG